MRICIAGSRSFEVSEKNFIILLSKLDYIVDDLISRFIDPKAALNEIEIVSGTADGADKLGEMYAMYKQLKLKRFPADWNTYGKSAGVIRNKEMAEYSDYVVIFWDSKSNGTKHMIESSKELGKLLHVFDLNGSPL